MLLWFFFIFFTYMSVIIIQPANWNVGSDLHMSVEKDSVKNIIYYSWSLNLLRKKITTPISHIRNNNSYTQYRKDLTRKANTNLPITEPYKIPAL